MKVHVHVVKNIHSLITIIAGCDRGVKGACKGLLNKVIMLAALAVAPHGTPQVWSD